MGVLDLVDSIVFTSNRSVKRDKNPQNYEELLNLALQAMFPNRSFQNPHFLHAQYESIVCGILRTAMLSADVADNEMDQFKLIKKDSFKVNSCLPENQFYAARLNGTTFNLPPAPPNTRLHYHFKNHHYVITPQVLLAGFRTPRCAMYEEEKEYYQLDFGSGFYTFTNPEDVMKYVELFKSGKNFAVSLLRK